MDWCTSQNRWHHEVGKLRGYIEATSQNITQEVTPQQSLPHCLHPLWVRGQTLHKTVLRAGLSNQPGPVSWKHIDLIPSVVDAWSFFKSNFLTI
jgi:hypothetical protein